LRQGSTLVVPIIAKKKVGFSRCGIANGWKVNAAGAKQAEEKGSISGKLAENIPQGLKPALILKHLRHD
jgi:hypothetical protein